MSKLYVIIHEKLQGDSHKAFGNQSRTRCIIASNSTSGKRTMPFLSGNNRLTATVVILSQIADAARPSIVVRSVNAHRLLPCAWVEQGMTVAAPCNVLRYDMTITGLRFQNSGNCASRGKSHQNNCLTFGAPIKRGFILGGGCSALVIIPIYINGGRW